MSNNAEQRSTGAVLDDLANAVFESKEETRSTLRAVGKDPDTVRAKGQRFIDRMRRKSRLIEAQTKQNRLARMRAQLRERLDPQAQKNPKRLLAGVMAEDSKHDLQFHFRKIEKLTDEDAIEMLSEIEILRLMEELSEENENGD